MADQMKRRIISDGEEEEEEDMGKTNSLRKRERISYGSSIGQHGDDEDREEEDQKDNEQLGPSTQLQYYNQGAHGKNLPVTCGVKKGSLDVEKLAKGVDCILCESQWFSPPAFETYAGKHYRRKWKATIFYNGERLKTLIDKGILTAKSYRGRRNATTKSQKVLSLHIESGSSSEATEIYSGEETEEDDVQGNNWLPEKGEKEWQGAESGGDVNKTEEEEVKIEEWEIEDESVLAVTDEDNNNNNNNVCEEIETNFITSACGKMAARVVLKRLEEERTERQSICPGPEQPEEESWCMPLDDHTESEEKIQHNGSAIDDSCVTAASQIDTCWMPGVKSERDESGERKDGQTEIQTKTRKPARILPAPATSSKPEDTQSISDNAANIRSSPVSETSTSLTNDMIGHSLKPLSEQADNPMHTDANDHKAAQIQKMNRDTRNPQTSHSSDMEEVSPSRCSADIKLDTMDLDQLKKEKIKMQIKVLKLQEEYYNMKIQGFRK